MPLPGARQASAIPRRVASSTARPVGRETENKTAMPARAAF